MAKRISVRTVIVAMLMGAMVGVGGASFAATNWGDWTYTSTNGTAYKSKAGMNDTSLAAYTQHGRRYSGNAPSGYLGIQPRGYRDSGSLCATGAWTYNNGAAHEMSAPVSPRCGKDYYYSHGQVRSYTGAGYETSSTYISPVQYIP
jgi:hypothetical protein